MKKTIKTKYKSIKPRMRPLNLKRTFEKYGNEAKDSYSSRSFLERLQAAEVIFETMHQQLTRTEFESAVEKSLMIEMIKQNYIVCVVSELEIFFRFIIPFY